MLLRTRGRNVEVRAEPFSSTSQILPWSRVAAFDTFSGAMVNRETAGGLPAAGAAIRLIAESIGMIPLMVYRGDVLNRERARDTWQWDLLHDAPNDESSAFDFIQDIAASIETMGDAFVWKVKVRRGRVESMFLVDPSWVTVRRDEANRKVFDVFVDGQKETFDSSTILHIRGWTLSPGADRGLSPIALHRHVIGSALAQREFEGRFYRNNATPGMVIEAPGNVSRPEAEEMEAYWEQRHAGLQNAHRPAILAKGASLKPIGIPLRDAQFVELKRHSVEDVARIFRISVTLLGGEIGGRQGTTKEDFERFLKLDLAPRLRRIEMAFRADPDLFPTDNLFPEFNADAVLRPDIKTRYEAYRLGRQGGWLKPNEIRARENLPPADGGDEIQETPVGGAPNV